MKIIKRSILLFLFLFIIWILFTNLEKDELIVGGIVALLITILFNPKAKIFEEIKLNPKAIVFSILYIFVFLIELIKSNFDVASRVVNPSLPINPGIVKVKTKLKSSLGRIFLANSITLTPGTLTVETKGDYFYIHWIDVSAKDIDENTSKIVSKFEKYLEVIFG